MQPALRRNRERGPRTPSWGVRRAKPDRHSAQGRNTGRRTSPALTPFHHRQDIPGRPAPHRHPPGRPVRPLPVERITRQK